MANFNGTVGNDVIIGTLMQDVITSGDGNDTIAAGEGNNWVNAGDGDDSVTAGAGDDTVSLGEGNNWLSAGDGNNVMTAGRGNDTVSAGQGNDVIAVGEGNNTVAAGNGNNSVSAGSGDDVVNAGSGNDVVSVGFGDNLVAAGDGNNVVTAASGNDTVSAGSGNDVISVGFGDNLVAAGDGNNVVTAASGNDTVSAGSGNDVISVGFGDNLVAAGGGNNVVTAASGNDTITTGAGNDVIAAGEGDNIIDAGAGYDVASAGAGTDLFIHRLSGNTLANGLRDIYQGGYGRDTLRLELTSAEWARADVQSDVAAFLAHLAQSVNQTLNPLGLSTQFNFSVTSLAVFNIENLEILVNGVLLNPRDEAVTAVLDRIQATEDSASVSVDLLANDAVPDRAVSVQLLSNSTLGTLALTPSLDGAAQSATLTFTPNAALQSLAAGQSVTETISYRVTDADGDTSTASITITVVGQNDGATISGVSTGSAVEDNGTVVGGTVTVSDVDNGEAIFQTPNGLNGTYGSFTFNANSGAWAYDLNDAAANVQALRAGETVQDRITVTSLDGTASQQILVTITGTNDAPVVAAALVAAVNEGEALQTINLLAGASDVDTGETATLSVANVTGLVAGLTLVGNTIVLDAADPSFDDLAFGQTRDLTVTYDVIDANGASAAQSATITITGTNDGPVVSAPVLGAANEGGAVQTINLLAGASDVDAGETATLSVANVTGLVAGLTLVGNTIVLDPTDASFDDLALGQTRDLTVTYDVVDAQGASVAQTATITITGTNDAPVVAADVTAGANEDDAALSIDLLSGASDVDAGETATLSVANVSGLVAGLTLNGNSIVVDPSDASFNDLGAGQTRDLTVTYDVVDAQGATVSQTATITITGTNSTPVVSAPVLAAASEGGAVQTINLLAGASDADAGETATLSVANVTGLGNGLALSGNSIVLDPANVAFNDLALGQTRDVTVTYDVIDTQGASVAQTATITITGTADLPVVTAQTFAAMEDTVITGQVVATDVDAGETAGLTYALANPAAAPVGLTFNADGSFVFDAASYDSIAQGSTRTVTFDVTATDPLGFRSAPQTISLEIAGTNDAPVAQNVSLSGGQTVNANFNQGFTGWTVLSGPETGPNGETAQAGTYRPVTVVRTSLGFIPGDTAVADLSFSATLNSRFDGPTIGTLFGPSLISNPFTGIAGDTVSFAYRTLAVDDDASITAVLVNIQTGDITPVFYENSPRNSPSPTKSVNVPITEGGVYQIRFTVGSFDATDGGVVGARLLIGTAGIVRSNVSEDSQRTFDPIAFTGSATDVDQGAVITLASVDAISQNGAAVSINSAGQVVYDASALDHLTVGEVLTDSFSYTITDEFGATSSATATITVEGVNDAPVVAGQVSAAATEGDGVQTISLLAGAIDADRGETATLRVANVTGLVPGLVLSGTNVVLDPTSSAFNSLAEGQIRTITLTYNVIDANGASVAQSAAITITGTNDAPVVSATPLLLGVVVEGQPAQTFNLLSGATDVDAGETATLVVANVTGLVDGLTLSGNSIVIDPSNAAFNALAAGQTATINVSYDVVDAQGASVRQDAYFTLTGTNDAATITGISTGSTAEDSLSNTYASGVLQVADPDSGQSTLVAQIIATGSAGLGTFNVYANGVWNYQIDNTNPAVQALSTGQTVVDRLTVVSADGTASQEIIVRVNGRDEPLVLTGTSNADALTVPSSNSESARIIGNAGSDTIIGGSGADVIFGDGVNDVQSPVVVAGPLTATAASYYTGSNNLINGLGGTAGFGEGDLARGDDFSIGPINLTSIFGSTGLNFFGTNYTSLYISSNGYVTFGGGAATYTPTTISANGFATIASFFADVDTRFAAMTASPGGTSTGANLISYDVDAANGVFTMTLNDVGQFSAGSIPNATQLMLVDRDNGNFDIILRYESVNWNYANLARAGFTSGGATPVVFEIPGSGTGASLNWDATAGNTGLTGIYVLEVRDGAVTTNLVDRITGGAGNDTITGGDGADVFVFNSIADGVDTITDFASTVDDIGISVAGFGGGLVAGGAASVQNVAALANAANTQFIFILDNDASGGNLYWDADGGAADNAVLLARLSGVTSLTSNDFFLF